MNQMYSNHLLTIDLILGVVAFFILLAGGVFGWIGYPQILKMIQRNVDKNVATATKEAIETAVAPLREEYKNLLTEQEKQEEQIEEQNKQIQAEHYFVQANRASDKKKYKEALAHLDKAIALDPHNTNTYINRGVTHIKLTQYEAAITDLNRAIELDPHNTNAYINRGNVNIALKQYDAAIQDCNKTLELGPNNAPAYYNKACAYSLLKKPASETLDLLKKAIELDEKYIQIARKDDDFKALRKNPKFRKMVGLDDEE